MSNATTRKKTFNKKLSAVIRSTKAARANIQNLCMLAMEHYVAEDSNGDTSLLASLVNKLNDVGSVNARRLQDYIESHANVTYTVIKNAEGEKQNVFKKRKGETVPEVITPTIDWWNFKRDKHGAKPVDEIKYVTSMVSTLQKRIDDKKVVNIGRAKKVLAELKKAEAACVKLAS